MYRSEEDAREAPAGVSSVIADFSSKESVKCAVGGADTHAVLESKPAGILRPRKAEQPPLLLVRTLRK